MIPADETGVTSFSTPTDREIVIRRVFEAAPPRVFDAWTRCEDLRRWMTGPGGWTMEVCEIDLRPGGAWRYLWRGPDGSEMEMTGEFVEVEPPRRLVTLERWSGAWAETRNTLVLAEDDGRTVSTTTVEYPSKEARDAALESGMQEGLKASYRSLDAHLDG